MKKYFYSTSSWIWRNKGKSIFLGLFIFGATYIFIDFVRLPWKIDFWLYWSRYQSVIQIFEENKNISSISYYEISWLNWYKKSCSNPSLRFEDFPRTTREIFWISEPCNVTYNYIFDAVKKADVAYIMRVSENDKSIRILTNSLYSRVLDTSYIYSKGFFKAQNLWRNYPQILNEDWWVYQDLN